MKRRDGACTCHPVTEIVQYTQKARTKNAHAKYFVLDHPSLTKSVRMHKHANETCAGAGNSDSCSWLNAATDAAAPGHAYLASRQALQAPPRCWRQHTELDNTNTGQRKQGTRSMRGHALLHAMRAACEPTLLFLKIINDILSQIRKDYLKPKCVTTYIHFLSTPRCSCWLEEKIFLLFFPDQRVTFTRA